MPPGHVKATKTQKCRVFPHGQPCFKTDIGVLRKSRIRVIIVEFKIKEQFIRIAPQDRAALEQAVATRLIEGQGFVLATLNLDHLVKLPRDPAFLAAYARHDMIVADGNPIVWLSWLAGRPVGLVPGSDMVMPLARIAAECGAPLALLGSTPPVLAKAANALQAQVPGLQIAAQIAPPRGFDPAGPEADAMITQLEQSGARFCLLALGAPKQEIFAARACARLPGVGFAAFGAGLDFIAGEQMRAPEWMRAMALEWLWRMWSHPRRMVPRYARCVVIFPQHVVRALRLRTSA